MNEVTEAGAAAKGKGGNRAAGAGKGNVAGAGRARAAGEGKRKAAGEGKARVGGEGKGKNKAAGEGKGKVEGQIGRMLVRAIWAQEWVLANPDAQGEQRKAAWKDGREAAIERNLKTYRRAINALSRSGVTMTLSETVAKASDEGDGGE